MCMMDVKLIHVDKLMTDNLIGIAEPVWAITGILVQHRYDTDTTLDTNRMIYRNVYHVMGIDGFWGGEFGHYRGPGSWGLPP